MRVRIPLLLATMVLLTGCTAIKGSGQEHPDIGLSTQWLTEEPFRAAQGAQLRVTARNNASSPLNATIRFHYPAQVIGDHVTVTHENTTTDRIDLGRLGPGDARGEAVHVAVDAHSREPTFPVNVSLYAEGALIDSEMLSPTFKTPY